MGDLVILLNKSVYHNYFVVKKYLSGIVLKGWEVRNIKKKNFQIKNSHAVIRSGEIYLLGMSVSGLEADKDSEKKSRARKLLLNKSEIKKIIEMKKKDGITIVPICCMLKNHLIKIEIAIAKGKREYDKRNIIKE